MSPPTSTVNSVLCDPPFESLQLWYLILTDCHGCSLPIALWYQSQYGNTAVDFWIFYVSLCMVTIWIAFKFMSAEKILKYNVIESLTKFTPLKESVDNFIKNEAKLDNQIQPSGNTVTNLIEGTDDLPME